MFRPLRGRLLTEPQIVAWADAYFAAQGNGQSESVWTRPPVENTGTPLTRR